jgi:mannose/fructose/N-acetylgalactosamine-specific phosphotransferase system component IIB
VAWGHRFDPHRIWVADDASAASTWERELLASSAPGIDVRVVTVAEAAARHAAEETAAGGAFLLVRDLMTALALVENGVRVASFNVGGLHYAPGKDKVHESVYLDDRDRAAIRALLQRGVALPVQDVPASRPVPIETLDPALRSARPGATP